MKNPALLLITFKQMRKSKKQYTPRINVRIVIISVHPLPQHIEIKHLNLSPTSLSLQIDLQKVYPVPKCFVTLGVSFVYLLTMFCAIKKTIQR